MTRVYLKQRPESTNDDNGIGRIVHAQHRLLPHYGIELVEDPAAADVIATHIEGMGLPSVDVLHCHGLYFDDLPHDAYQSWHHTVNQRVIATARQARAITVPSPWVAECFRRDMRLTPEVIGHGVDVDQWDPLPVEQRRGYLLWNKNRKSDVCSPAPAYELARRGVPVVTTFAPDGAAHINNIYLIGTQPFDKMREFVRHAGVYLATTPETFGVGTLEALAAGVPVLGYRWAGTADLVEHGITGWLVEPGDIDGLRKGWDQLQANWSHYSTMAAATGRAYTWERAMRQYADLYQRVAEEKAKERHMVCVVITNYNYGKYLRSAMDSLRAQVDEPDEIVIVDDGSTDDSEMFIKGIELQPWSSHNLSPFVIRQTNQGVAAARNNGIAATNCEYIICLDADDQLAPDYIRVCRAALKADRALGIAYTGLGTMPEQGGPVTPSQFPPAFDWEHQAKPNNPPHTCVPTAAMFRRSLWERAGGYKQVFAPGEDAEFYTRGLSVGYTARKVADDPWIWYRNHAGGASKTKQYKAYDAYHPWMRDQHYPMAAPSTKKPIILSYSRPLIAVVIPVGPGHARYLPAAIDSLLSQSYRQWECIVVNDTGAGLGNVMTPYPFVRILATEGRRGPGPARNLGMQAVNAPLTLFLDADDWLADPDALKQMLAAQAKTGRYIYSDWVNVEGDRVWADEAPAYDQRAWFGRGQHAVTALIPTEWIRAIEGFDESLDGWEDWDFFAKLAARGFCGHRVAGALLGYRKHSGTMRDQSWANRERLAPLIRQRYEGVTPMGCGCGPSGEALIRIRQTLTEDDIMGTQLQEGQTLMEYTGGKQGTSSVRSRSKRVDGQLVRYWYGGDTRLLPVWDEDVGHMESIGFRRAMLEQAAFADVPIAPISPAGFAAERSAATAPAMPFAHPHAPDEAVADVGDVEAMFNQDALRQHTDAKAEAARETVRGRPGRKPKAG